MVVIMLAFMLIELVLGDQIVLFNKRHHMVTFQPNNQDALVFVMSVKDFIIGDVQTIYELNMRESNGSSAILMTGLDSIPNDLEYEEKYDIYPGGEGGLYFSFIRKSDIYLVFMSEYSCRLKITVTVTERTVQLIENKPIKIIGNGPSTILYSFDVKDSNLDYLSICLTNKTYEVLMYITKDLDELPNQDNTEPVLKTWSGNAEYRTTDVKIGSKFLVFVDLLRGDNQEYWEALFYIMLKTSSAEFKQLELGKMQNSMITNGEGSESYFFEIESDEEIAEINFETFNGNGYILISHLESVSDENYDFASAYHLNVTIIINPEDRLKLGKTTGKYFIRVFGSGIFFYSLLYTNLKSKYHQIVINYPEKGVAYENQIIYFIFESLKIESKINVFLEVLSGNSDLYAKVCKNDILNCEFSENEIENPIDIYSSLLKEGNEYIEISNYPKNCYEPSKCFYIIGVLGKSEKSHFQIDLTSTTDQLKLSPQHPVNLKTNGKINFIISDFSTNKVTLEVTALEKEVPMYAQSEYYIIKGGTQFKWIYDSHSFNWTRGVDFPSVKGKYTLYIESYHTIVEGYWFSVTAKIERITHGEITKIYSNTPIQDLVYNTSDQYYKIYSFSVYFNESEIFIKVTPIFGKVKFSLAKTSEKFKEKIDIKDYDWIVPKFDYVNDSLVFYIKSDDPLYEYNTRILILVEGEEFIFDKSSVYSIECSEKGEFLMYRNQGINQTVGSDGTMILKYPLYYKHRDIFFSIEYSENIELTYISVINGSEVCSYSPTIIVYWECYKDMCQNLIDNNKKVDHTDCYLYFYLNFQVKNYPGSIYTMLTDIRFSPVKVKLNTFIKKGKDKPGFYYCYISARNDLIISFKGIWNELRLHVRIQDRNKTQNFERPENSLDDHEGSESEMYFKSKEIKNSCPSGNCTFLLFIRCIGTEMCPTGFELIQKNDDNEGKHLKIVLWVLASIFFIIITLIIYCCKRRISSKFRWQNLDGKNDIVPESKIEMRQFDIK